MEELKYRLGEDHPTYQSEHMATLFGLLCRATEELAGEEVFGRVIPWCVARYGRERGSRMAQRCLADGRPLTMLNYRCYSEWRPQPGTHQHNLIRPQPGLQHDVDHLLVERCLEEARPVQIRPLLLQLCRQKPRLGFQSFDRSQDPQLSVGGGGRPATSSGPALR